MLIYSSYHGWWKLPVLFSDFMLTIPWQPLYTVHRRIKKYADEKKIRQSFDFINKYTHSYKGLNYY